jgi:hypothetical protein
MMDIEVMRPVKWDQFCDVVRLSDDRQFAILEQRRLEQCGAIPSPENDVIVGAAMVVWSEHFICVMKTSWKQDYPLETTGTALNWVIKNPPEQSQINLYSETAEVYEALKMSNKILTRKWDTQMYFTVPKWIQLIQTMCTCGSEVTGQEIDQRFECPYWKMRMLAIREAQEEMVDEVSIRENGYPVFAAYGGTGMETALRQRNSRRRRWNRSKREEQG